jgi:enoyl-CoA hydratase/carnithine racemase
MSSATIESVPQTTSAAAPQPADIVTEKSGSILRVQLNRPAKKNAMTSAMYLRLAEILNEAAKDDGVRVVVLHGAGNSFTAGNDVEDFLKHPFKGADDAPQAPLIAALIAFEKPLIAAVHGVAIGGGTTMLTHFDFVYAAEETTFQLPFVNLALVPEFGSSYSIPSRIGYIAAAELFLLGQPFDARRAAELGFVTRVVSEHGLLAVAMETAEALAAKSADALRASKKLLKRWSRKETEAAVMAEIGEFATQLSSADAKEAFTAFFEKRRPDFSKTKSAAVSH